MRPVNTGSVVGPWEARGIVPDHHGVAVVGAGGTGRRAGDGRGLASLDLSRRRCVPLVAVVVVVVALISTQHVTRS